MRPRNGEAFTVDDLYEIPDNGNRYEVLDGSLHIARAPAFGHHLVVHEVYFRLRSALPRDLRVVTRLTMRLPDDQGPVADVAVTTAKLRDHRGPVPASEVHTVVEVATTPDSIFDREYRPEIYAGAGIPCYWRVERYPWPGYRGPLPLVLVRFCQGGTWHTIEAPAGTTADLPVAVGRGNGDLVTVKLDPADLVDY